MDRLTLLTWPTLPFKQLCRVPQRLEGVTDRGEEVAPRDVGLGRDAVERIWRAAEVLYQTGLHPAVQLQIRHRGAIVIDRALGHASGNAPGERSVAPVPATTATPFLIYSASKAVTAMVVHLLDDRGALHVDDLVCDYLPEFRRPGKDQITIAHVLCHRAGIPSIPRGAMDLDLLERPSEIVGLLAEAPLLSRPGRRLAYHAVTGGFVLAEVVRKATGQSIREVLTKEIREPLGLRWMNYGVAADDLPAVGRDALTGLPPFPPIAQLFGRILGVPADEVVDLAMDPRFLTGVIPAANVVTTAHDLCSFYECLLREGELDGVRVFEPRTVHRATAEQSYWEADLTLGAPIRYGLGFMLGATFLPLFGPDAPHAYGHFGFTNIASWADPERELSGALIASGKPFLTVEMVRFYQVLMAAAREIPKTRVQ
ncbi:MAG: serine hydrolase domain-containing protein [Myxococcota bacterium]|nr:serine hydrolase domain-containing protein [Myxococcota bacterium]